MAFKRRVDANHSEVKQALESAGWDVADTHTLGRGFPDLVIGKGGLTILVEVKSGEKAGLTQAEAQFFSQWSGGPLLIVRSALEAVEMVEAILDEVRGKHDSD